MCDMIGRLLKDSRPVDQIMLVIELLILLFIVWEFAWKAWDWFKARGERKEYESDLEERLTALKPQESSALMDFALHNRQPVEQTTLSRLDELELISRNFTGWFIPRKHKKHLRRWAKGKSKSPKNIPPA